MVGQLNEITSVGASGTATQLRTGNGVVKAIYVTKANAGDIMFFLDGTTNNGVTQFQVESDAGLNAPLINRTFTNGIIVVFTGTTARYLVVYE